MSLGATPEEWTVFSRLFGDAILPSVCDKNANGASKAPIGSFLKRPSAYSTSGLAYGFSAWQAHRTSNLELERWKQNENLGICAVMRDARCLDIDITDEAIVNKAMEIIAENLGVVPARVGRAPKVSVYFRPADNKPDVKRIIYTPWGNIEFLANRQQSMLAGTHACGARYTWAAGLPTEIPTVANENIAACFDALVAAFGIAGKTAPFNEHGELVELRKTASQIDDPFVRMLDDAGVVHSYQQDGKVNIRCPWSDEHTLDSADSATSYMPAGHNGLAAGFSCLHSHCTDRTVNDVWQKYGYQVNAIATVDDFDADPTAEPVKPTAFPIGLTDKGKLDKSDHNNAGIFLMDKERSGLEIKFDIFTDQITIEDENGKRLLSDNDITAIRLKLKTAGFTMGNEPARQLICLIAEKNKEDTALDWINGLVWDGVPRLKDFYPKILKTADTEYEREVGLYQWTAMAGRILEPGIKADMTPVWIGKQGTRKSTAVGAMVPYDSGFWSVDLHKVGDKDQARYARGKLIGEMAEMKGLASAEGDSIKAWLTQTEDEIVEKYKSQATKRKRRCIFIGTHNHNRFLRDLTGNRRWLPVAVAKTGKIDTDYIRANRDQLWAEAAVLFRESGIAFQRAEELAEPYQRNAVIRDPWYSKALEVLTTGGVTDVTVASMFSAMQGRGLNDLTLAIEHRIKNCLYSCGYEEVDDVWVLPDLA